MEYWKKTKRFSSPTLVILHSLLSTAAWCADHPTPLPSSTPPPVEGFLHYKPSIQEKYNTYQFLNKQDQPNLSRDESVKNYESGKSRALQMVNMLQNQELTKAFQKITDSGNKTLNENKEIKTPLAVIAGAASLWYGKTLKLIRGDSFNLSARLEGRAQRSEFSMASPLLNGKLKFDAREGSGIGINRSISATQTEAAVQYNMRDQVISTEVRQRLSPNLDLSFGASKIDQNTKVEYRFNF